jgi:hypothetical protein
LTADDFAIVEKAGQEIELIWQFQFSVMEIEVFFKQD